MLSEHIIAKNFSPIFVLSEHSKFSPNLNGLLFPTFINNNKNILLLNIFIGILACMFVCVCMHMTMLGQV